PEIIKEVARRAALTEKADVLFLEALPHRIPLDYRSHFSGKSVEVEKFTPNQINLPRLKYIVKLTKDPSLATKSRAWLEEATPQSQICQEHQTNLAGGSYTVQSIPPEPPHPAETELEKYTKRPP
ncbi:hypothetical protein DSO57_1029573, partial [Entomophthora muscae]